MKSNQNVTDELLDLVNENDEIIGTIWKSEAHKDIKKIHREIRLFVFDKLGNVLLQQRALTKKNGPGSWGETAAGHVNIGEDPSIAAKREIKEELGIDINPFFYKKVFDIHSKDNENEESRFTYIYFSKLTKHPKLILQKSEVNDAKWVKVKDLEHFAKNNIYSLIGISHECIIEIANKLKII